MIKSHSDHGPRSSRKKKNTRHIKLILNKTKKFVKRNEKKSFQTTDSEPISENLGAVAFDGASSLFKDHRDSSGKIGDHVIQLRDNDDDDDSNATDRVDNRPVRQLSFNLSNLETSSKGGSEKDFRCPKKKRNSWTMKNIITPLANSFRRRRRIRRSDTVPVTRRRQPVRTSNGSISFSIKSSEYGDDSERLDQFDLSFSIMPRASMRNLMSQRNIDPDLIDVIDETETVGLLAESRTPSFNVMLHANEYYSDSCTLIKRKTVRITWENLANNTHIEEEDYDDDSRDLVLDIGGRRVSDMRFESQDNFNSEVFGVRGLRSRGSLLVRMPSVQRTGSNRGGIPLWSGTSTINFNPHFNSFVVHEKTKEWLKSFKACDPRHQILTFFNDVANEGATGDADDFTRDHISPLLKYLYRASVFSVWRPTSLQSIRRMILGEGVGKGLDIKGKSAKRGKLSAFVPFMQIYEEEDKEKVRTLFKDSSIRVFFNNERDRNIVVKNLNELAKELGDLVRASKKVLEEGESMHDEDTLELAMKKMTLDMTDKTIDIIDTYTSSNKYGIEVQERLFWEGMVVRQNIYRKPGSRDDIGRTSMPSFQDMNFSSLRAERNSVPGGHTRAVILQYKPQDDDNVNPMSPLNLLMAYEENDPGSGRRRVIPVVSDFDCFIVGTRGVRYEEEVSKDQINVLKWMVDQTEGILEKPNTDSWTKRWLDVLKESGNKGFHPKIPDGGYSDPKTGLIFKHAINRLGTTGAVRHGAECYNYYFPQDLDEELLVISDELPEKYGRCNWTYVDQDELKDILKFKIDKGYTFPVNLKWVLCDEGWKEVYDKLLLSNKANVQQSLNCFYPPDSGLRQKIEEISKKYPDGFDRVEDDRSGFRDHYRNSFRSTRLSQIDGTIAMDLAEQELKYYFVLQRARNRLKAYLTMKSILNHIRAENVRKKEERIAAAKENGESLDSQSVGESRVTEIEEGEEIDVNNKKENEDERIIIKAEIEKGEDLNGNEEKESELNRSEIENWNATSSHLDKPNHTDGKEIEKGDNPDEEAATVNEIERKGDHGASSQNEEDPNVSETEMVKGVNLDDTKGKSAKVVKKAAMSRLETFL